MELPPSRRYDRGVHNRCVYGVLLFVFINVEVNSPGIAAQIKKEVYLVGIGTESIPDTDELAQSLSATAGVRIKQLTARGMDSKCYSAARNQFDSRCLLDRIDASFPELVERHGVIIAVTRNDIYIPGVPWNFAFSYRERGIAVVSAARMRIAGNTLMPPGTALESTRLRKMVLKNIGIMYFGMSPKSDPHSVLYDKILGLEELDEVQEHF